MVETKSNKKNIILLQAVDIPEMRINRKDYNPDVFKIGAKSFENWAAKQNNIDVFIIDELLYPVKDMKITIQRYHAMDILDANGIEYDQVCFTDCDAIIHPECPNFFELTDHKYTITNTFGSMDWVCRSIENWGKYLFDGNQFPFYDYFNGGFQIFNKEHKHIHENLLKFYWENKDKILWLQDNFHVGGDQPLINYIVHNSGVEKKYLPYEFCMTDLVRCELLREDMLFAREFKGIYQFNCLPSRDGKALMGDVNYWVNKTYNYLYGKK
tara:strand:- start:271 stop:1077 length:807 start_codon:yes stop_codon:yes gene_type:complete